MNVDAVRRTSPGLTPYRWAAARSTVDLDLRDVDELFRMEVDDARDHIELVLDLLGEVLQLPEVVPVDPDDDRIARTGQDLADPLLEIGLHVAPQAGIAVDHLQDGGVRLVVVDGRVDADPVLAELDTVRLVGDERLADVRAAVADTRDRSQLVRRRRW